MRRHLFVMGLVSLVVSACGDRPVAPTYSVGGSVSGLQGGALTVSNGTDSLTVTGDGNFVFPTQALSGAPYQVSITQTPAGLACAVNDAGGTVGGTNVSTPHVVCSAKTFAISGYVNGNPNIAVSNGNDVLTVSSGGSFQFPTALPEGATYSISVTSPAGETCVVQNANGTIGTNVVSNVQVTCATNTYTVGGAVHGLTGSVGLAMQPISGVRVTSNSNFVFPRALPNDSNYAVTVALQPLGQNCTVTNPNGTIAGDQVTDVSVDCTTLPTTYTVGGTITGVQSTASLQLNGSETLQVSQSGVFHFTTTFNPADTYNVAVTSSGTGQVCRIQSGASGTIGNFSVANVAVVCTPFIAFTNNQNADFVVGQVDFVSNATGTDANSLYEPWGVPTNANNMLITGDGENNRILGFALPITANYPTAIYVLGQSNFTTRTDKISQKNMSYPETVTSDGNALAFLNDGGTMVRIYNQLPPSPGGLVNQDVVIGEHGSFTAEDDGCAGDSLYYPNAAYMWNGHLAVADTSSNRILIWNHTPTTSSPVPPPDLVLGAPNPNTCLPSAGGVAGMYEPDNVWSDGNRVLVADTRNHRVLIWNTFPQHNGQLPDVVVGQPDFDNVSSASTGQATLTRPEQAILYKNMLLVADYGNNRVLIWNAVPTTNGVPADAVLGQAGSDPTQYFTTNSSGLTAANFNGPSGLLVVNGQLFIADSNNSRILVYNLPVQP